MSKPAPWQRRDQNREMNKASEESDRVDPWNAVFEMDLWEKDDVARQRQMIVEAVLAYVKPESAGVTAV